MSHRRHGTRSDRGSATPLALSLLVGAMGLVVGLGLAAQAFLAHARADGTADLAALAAADAARGLAPGTPCEVAEELVTRDGADLVDCLANTSLGTVIVEVEVDLPPPLTVVRATGVAGPPG